MSMSSPFHASAPSRADCSVIPSPPPPVSSGLGGVRGGLVVRSEVDFCCNGVGGGEVGVFDSELLLPLFLSVFLTLFG